MSDYQVRKLLLSKYKEIRKRDVITLVTSTKDPSEHFSAQIAVDLLPILYSLLKQPIEHKALDLIIYSAGGQIDAPWAIVNLIREFYSEFNVIVPSKAHSAATLIALGADNIEMSPLGMLSPVDPQLTVKRPDPIGNIRVGVEDIYGYYSLLNETLGLSPDGKTEALKLLADRVGAEILGQVSRIRNEIRIIATNLLSLHMSDQTKIEQLVSSLVEKLHSHNYMIGRKEAKRIGLPITFMDGEVCDLVLSILDSYIKETKMNEPGIQFNIPPGENKQVIDLNRAFVENEQTSFAYRTQYTLYKDGKMEKRINAWEELSQ